MMFHLPNKSEVSISNFSECIEVLFVVNILDIDISVDASEISADWLLFQKNFFIADLLGLNSVVIFGSIENKLKKRVSELFEKSIFNTQPQVIFSEEEKKGFEFSRRLQEGPITIEKSNLATELRTIIIWEGTEIFKPKTEVRLKFYKHIVDAKVLQIQKVINQDFQGSVFGVNQLELGEIGTVSLDLESSMEQFCYEDNQFEGIFVLLDSNDKQLGFGINI